MNDKDCIEWMRRNCIGVNTSHLILILALAQQDFSFWEKWLAMMEKGGFIILKYLSKKNERGFVLPGKSPWIYLPLFCKNFPLVLILSRILQLPILPQTLCYTLKIGVRRWHKSLGFSEFSKVLQTFFPNSFIFHEECAAIQGKYYGKCSQK